MCKLNFLLKMLGFYNEIPILKWTKSSFLSQLFSYKCTWDIIIFTAIWELAHWKKTTENTTWLYIISYFIFEYVLKNILIYLKCIETIFYNKITEIFDYFTEFSPGQKTLHRPFSNIYLDQLIHEYIHNFGIAPFYSNKLPFTIHTHTLHQLPGSRFA